MNDKRTLLIFLALGGALLAFCGVVGIVAFLFARTAASGVPSKAPFSSSFNEWYSSEPCLVDANGDGTLDVAGFSGTPDQQTVPTALDGRTGKVLWEATAYREHSHAHCGDEHTLLVSHPGFHLDGLDAKTGKRKWNISLEDEVQSVWPGHGCVEVVLANLKHDGIQTSTGARTTCRGQEPLRDSLSRDPSEALKWSARAGDLEATLSTRFMGTQVLELSVSHAGKTKWTKRLDVMSQMMNPPFLGIDDDVIVVGGFDLVDKEYLVWLGFSASTGKQLYRRKESSHWSSHFPHAKLGRGVLYSYWGYGIGALEPKTGERRWQFGGR